MIPDLSYAVREPQASAGYSPFLDDAADWAEAVATVPSVGFPPRRCRRPPRCRRRFALPEPPSAETAAPPAEEDDAGEGTAVSTFAAGFLSADGVEVADSERPSRLPPLRRSPSRPRPLPPRPFERPRPRPPSEAAGAYSGPAPNFSGMGSFSTSRSMNSSIRWNLPCSFSLTKVKARPVALARAVRPMRWM